MARREVIANFRTMKYFWFCVLLVSVSAVPIASSVYAPTLLDMDGSVRGYIWLGIVVLSCSTLIASAILGFASIFVLHSDAIYIVDGRLIYTWPFMFSMPLSEIAQVEVDRSRPGLGYGAKVRITRLSGRKRYIATGFLDQSAETLALRINRRLGAAQ
jgi:hypothetical protein